MKFHVTTDTTPIAYYYVAGKKTAWEVEEFHWLEEWLRQQEDAPEAEAEAEKGHAADQPSGEKTAQAEKGHAGDKATQGSGGSTQKVWSAPDPARKKAPRSSVGQPIVGDTGTDVVEEWSDELDTIAHRIRAVRGRERTPEPDRQMAREETHRRMHARKAEDKKILDGLWRRYKRQVAKNEADLMARIWETERAQVVRLSTSYGYSNPIGYQTSDFTLLWTITPNPQPPKPPMIGLCPPPNIRHALCPPYETCPPPPFLLPNSAPCFLDHGRRHELGM